MFDEAMSLLSLWASMHSWFTPTVLFLLLNLMIGTIAVTSGFTSSKPPHHHHHTTINLHQQPQITRVPSVMQRLKSINFYSYYSHSQPNTQVRQISIPPHQQQKLSPTYDPLPESAPESVPLPLLEEVPTRVQLQDTLPYEDTPLPKLAPGPVPSPHIEEVQPRVQVQDTLPQEDTQITLEDIDGPTMDEIYSKIKGTTPAAYYGRQNSDTKPTGGEIPVKLPAKMKKSASHKSPFNHFQPLEEPENVAPVKTVKERAEVPPVPKAVAAAAVGGDEEVDSKADDFINKFRQQLKLQRIESIVRYKDMITRSTAK